MNDLVNKESGESHSPIGLDRKDLPNYLAIKSREIAYEKKVSTNSILKPKSVVGVTVVPTRPTDANFRVMRSYPKVQS